MCLCIFVEGDTARYDLSSILHYGWVLFPEVNFLRDIQADYEACPRYSGFNFHRFTKGIRPRIEAVLRRILWRRSRGFAGCGQSSLWRVYGLSLLPQSLPENPRA
jgi:hypothetical protein